MTNDLVEFLRARLDEDEAAAKACIDINVRAAMRRGAQPARWEFQDGQIRSADGIGGSTLRVRHTWAAEGGHITRQDPFRVLRKIDSDRRILGLCVSPDGVGGYTEAYRDVVRLLASAYSDHQDYREEWKP